MKISHPLDLLLNRDKHRYSVVPISAAKFNEDGSNVNSTPLARINSTKYLGVTREHHLDWSSFVGIKVAKCAMCEIKLGNHGISASLSGPSSTFLKLCTFTVTLNRFFSTLLKRPQSFLAQGYAL